MFNISDVTTRFNLKRRGRVILFDCLAWEAMKRVHSMGTWSFATACEKHGFSLVRTK